MGIERTAALTALVPRAALSEGDTVRTGDTDGHALHALQLGGIGGLVVAACITADVIDIALFVVVVLRETCLQLAFEGIQVHTVGVEDILIHLFYVVPTLGDVYLVGIGFLGLLAATADDVRGHPVVHRIGEAVVLCIELLHTAATPSGMVFRDCQYLLSLRAVRVEVGVGSIDAIPMVTVQNAVVIGRRIVVTEAHAALVSSGDVPTLRVVVALRLAQIVCHPRGDVVVGEVEEGCHVVLATHQTEEGAADAVLCLFIEVMVVVIDVQYLAHLAIEQLIEGTLLQECVRCPVDACRNQRCSHVVKGFDVCGEVLHGEVARHTGDVVQQLLPIHIAYLRELEDGGYLLVDFQKLDVGKGQAAVGHHAFKLHTQRLGVGTYLHQVTAPIEGGLRTLQHHACHRPDLGHNLVCHHIVDAAVIVVLRATAPNAEVGECLALQELGSEDAGSGNLCGIVVLQDFARLLVIIALSHSSSTECGSHGGNDLLVVVHAVILRMNPSHDKCKTHIYYNKV